MWIDSDGVIVISQDTLWLVIGLFAVVLIFFGTAFGRPYRDDDDEK